MIGLIPAAGRGVRAYPYTENTPKCMLRLAGRPILEHNIRRLVSQLGVSKLYIVLGDHASTVVNHFARGEDYGVEIDPKTLEVDLEATQKLRKDRLAKGETHDGKRPTRNPS